MKKHIIFDFDGVIGDTFEYNWQIVQMLHAEVTKDQYRIDHHLGNVFAEPAVPFTRETSDEFYRQVNDTLQLAHITKALPTLRRLGRQYILHVVTSNCEFAVEKILAEGKVLQHFGMILGREAHQSKEEKFLHLAREEVFELKDSVYVTDTLGDIKEAQKVGLRTIAVTFGYHPRDLLLSGEPTSIASDWNEVEREVLDLVGH